MVLRFFLFASLFLLAFCYDAKFDNPDDPKSPNYIGNRLSSSAYVEPSSSSEEVPLSSTALSSSSSAFKSSSSAVKSSSSAVVSSSSSRPSSSSSVPPSSSSLAQSSSSVAVSSSSSKPSSSSSVPPSSSSVAKSSSSAVVSSSSSKLSSSSVVAGTGLCAGFVDGTKREHYGKEKEQFCDPRDGKKYVYVKIGTQTWMAENLNYDANGSKCHANSEANCTTYGKLYNWATALALQSNCNSNICNSQISAKHRGICPNGWHIPSNADWNVLMKFVNPNCSDNSSCVGAGTKLKAKDGWNNNGNGEDTYGFSALPGGSGYSGGGFFSVVGSECRWWSATETSSGIAYYRIIDYGYEDVIYSNYNKDYLFGVRCLQD